MTDREYFDVLVQRARSILQDALNGLRPPDNEDGRKAPHVSCDVVSRLDKVALKLAALAAVAQSEKK